MLVNQQKNAYSSLKSPKKLGLHMRSSKYTEHYTDTFITFKEIMRTVSNIYHNCVPDKIKNRRNTDQLKQRDTVIIACVIWGIINGGSVAKF